MTRLFHGSRIRLHWRVALSMALCLIAMTALVAGLTQARLRTSTQETAQALFSQVAQRNAQKLQDVLSTTGSAVQFLASLPPMGGDDAARTDRPRIMALLLAAVQAQPQLHSACIGFGSEEMLQVIGVRNQPHLAASLGTPQGSHFALRTIERSPAGVRLESWVFLDAQGVRTGERSAMPANYAPSGRPWFFQAQGLQACS